jgi:serine/threonine protein kinase
MAHLDQLCAEDPALRSDLRNFLTAQNATQSELLNVPAIAKDSGTAQVRTDDWIGQRIGPYKIVQEIGGGGMGTVYRAFRSDDQYQKEVAIKLVGVGHDSAFIRDRFKFERQILATLDHPNIARMLDGGTTDQGTPYFVMELIDGRRIDEYCRLHSLTIQERLQLFLRVCSAVQYAHQRLIVHRDIKPSNILVTAENVPKLLDFGIAKIVDAVGTVPGAEATMTMVRLLTPAYASPEQVKGETVTTASDVYSLGVVLYELLTGCSPYHGISKTQRDLESAVCELEPDKPSVAVRRADWSTVEADPASLHRSGGAYGIPPKKLSQKLSGDLDNILLTALRKEPRRRYASVEQFAEDIARHLDNRPVTARQDTVAYRTTKFVARHKAGVVAAVTMLLFLLTALAVTLREARIAEQRFNDVHDLANSLIFDIHDSIQDLPGSTKARKLIVEKALKYLDSLAKQSSSDPSLQRELAAAYKRIGDVQGYQFSANLGDTSGALKSYQKSLTIRQALFTGHPRSLDDAIAVAESSRFVAEMHLATGQTAEAFGDIKYAVENIEQLERTHPNDLKVLQELSHDYSTEAFILAGSFNMSNAGDASTALVVRQKELAVNERISTLDPGSPSARRSVALSLSGMGDQLLLGGQRHNALQYYLRAQRIFGDLAGNSAGRQALEELDGIYTRVQFVDLANGDFLKAVATDRSAVGVSDKLSSLDPNDVRAHLEQAEDQSNLSDALSRSNKIKEALSLANQSLVLMTQLVAQNPKNTEFRGVRAAVLITAGDVLRRARKHTPALQRYREAFYVYSKSQSDDPTNLDARLHVAATYNKIGEMLAKVGDLKSATDMYRNALQLAEPVATSAQPSEESLYVTADSYALLGEVESRIAAGRFLKPAQQVEHLKQAHSWYGKSANIWRLIKEPGVISPNGFDCVPPSFVTARLTELERDLKMQAAGGPQ